MSAAASPIAESLPAVTAHRNCRLPSFARDVFLQDEGSKKDPDIWILVDACRGYRYRLRHYQDERLARCDDRALQRGVLRTTNCARPVLA